MPAWFYRSTSRPRRQPGHKVAPPACFTTTTPRAPACSTTATPPACFHHSNTACSLHHSNTTRTCLLHHSNPTGLFPPQYRQELGFCARVFSRVHRMLCAVCRVTCAVCNFGMWNVLCAHSMSGVLALWLYQQRTIALLTLRLCLCRTGQHLLPWPASTPSGLSVVTPMRRVRPNSTVGTPGTHGVFVLA